MLPRVANGTRRASVRLFCVPYAGGNASAFRSWTGAVPPDIAIWPVHLPGRERRLREAMPTEAQALAALLAHELIPQADDGPFALFGHSMGGLIAFELARLLADAGRPPIHLFVSARPAPRRPRRGDVMHALPEDAFIARLRELNGMPEEILGDPQMMALLIPILRADFRLAETYCYREGPPLACPISALGGTGDALVTRDDLLAWREHTRGPFQLRLFAGGHFFLRESEHDVLRAVTDDLSPVRSATA